MSNGKMTIFETLGIVGLMILVFFVLLLFFSTLTTRETITVQGNITKVETFDNYIIVYMDNNQSYKINYPDENIDFTVHSKIILRLTNANIFWIDDGAWDSVVVIKSP